MVAQIQLQIPNAGKLKQFNVKSLEKTHVKTNYLIEWRDILPQSSIVSVKN